MSECMTACIAECKNEWGGVSYSELASENVDV